MTEKVYILYKSENNERMYWCGEPDDNANRFTEEYTTDKVKAFWSKEIVRATKMQEFLSEDIGIDHEIEIYRPTEEEWDTHTELFRERFEKWRKIYYTGLKKGTI